MDYLDFVFPLLLIGLTYLLKLFVDQVVDVPAAIRSFCELPIDIIFLSISLLIAIVVSKASNRDDGLVYMIGNLIVAIVIVFLAKRSAANFTLGVNNWWRLYLTINIFLSIFSLCISISMLHPAIKKEVKPSQSKSVNHGK
jgi:hypothetical protein